MRGTREIRLEITSEREVRDKTGQHQERERERERERDDKYSIGGHRFII